MRLPYPGLRAFRREESDLFFGREGCIDQMVDRLAATRFLAVLGPSGSGKSSLVRTGLLEALELGFLAQAGSRWTIVTMNPGDRPIANLAAALLSPEAADTADAVTLNAKLLASYLTRGPRSVVEWCLDGHLTAGRNLLLLVDQFEELFRYADYAGREQADAFVSLLLESSRAAEVPIYVVLTMRSEFLGACTLMPGLAERINAGLYLSPRMTREETREAIEGPAGVCAFSIEPALVSRLLNDLSSFAPWDDERSADQLQMLSRRADQLPLMQHVLNRLWLRAAAENAGPVVLKLQDYATLGGLSGALDAHASEIVDALGDDAPVVEIVFRALVAGVSLANAVRRPIRLGDLTRVAGDRRDAVIRVVNAFRTPDCNFLTPAADVSLRDDTVIDISHESLIRQWSQLAYWLEQEARAAAAWRRLLIAAELYREGQGDLLRGLDLANLLAWWDKEAPTAAWAERYGGGYHAVRQFLDASSEAEQAQRLLEEARERRERRNLRIGVAGLVVLLAIVSGIGALLLVSRHELKIAFHDLQRNKDKLEQANRGLIRTALERDEQRKRSEKSAREAEDVLNTTVLTLGDEQFFLHIGAEGLEQKLLEAMRPHFEAVAQLRASDGKLRQSEVAARLMFSRLMDKAVSTQAAEPAFRSLFVDLEAQAAKQPRHPHNCGTWRLLRKC